MNRGIVITLISEVGIDAAHVNQTIAGYNRYLATLQAATDCDFRFEFHHFDGFGPEQAILTQTYVKDLRKMHSQETPLVRAKPLPTVSDHTERKTRVIEHQRQRFGDDDMTPKKLAKWYPMTPLTDSIGRAISVARQLAKINSVDRVSLIVNTDHHGNFCQEIPQDDLTDLVRAKQKQGWNMIFMGKDLKYPPLGRLLGFNQSVNYTGSNSEQVWQAAAVRTINYTRGS